MILLLFFLGNGGFWWRGDRGPVWSLSHRSIPLPAKKAPEMGKTHYWDPFPHHLQGGGVKGEGVKGFWGVRACKRN